MVEKACSPLQVALRKSWCRHWIFGKFAYDYGSCENIGGKESKMSATRIDLRLLEGEVFPSATEVCAESGRDFPNFAKQ
jgi:hypothetical protein